MRFQRSYRGSIRHQQMRERIDKARQREGENGPKPTDNFMIGIFSAQQCEVLGSSIYSTPDGKEVEITAVASSEESIKENRWPDQVILGPVVKWLREGRKSSGASIPHKDDWQDDQNS